MIEFSSEIGFWSPFAYWYVVVNCIACALFTVVIIVGGIFDLRFLFRAIAEDETDETDDGRVLTDDGSDSHEA